MLLIEEELFFFDPLQYIHMLYIVCLVYIIILIHTCSSPLNEFGPPF